MAGYIFLTYIVKPKSYYIASDNIELTYRIVFQYVGPAFYFILGFLCLVLAEEDRATFKIASIQTITFIVFFFACWLAVSIIRAILDNIGGIILGIIIAILAGGSTYIVKKID